MADGSAVAIASAVGTVAGSILTIGVNAALAFNREKRADQRETAKAAAETARAERVDAMAEMQGVLDRTVEQLDRVTADLRACHSEHEETRGRCTATERGLARAAAWIESLQFHLDRAGFAYPRWTADPTGTGSTPALSLPVHTPPEAPRP